MEERTGSALWSPRGLVCSGDDIVSPAAGWTFSGDVPSKFTAHVRRSVPHYEAGHQLIAQLSDYFISPQSVGYDLGTSTGGLIRRLAARHPSETRWIGIDREPAMIRQAVLEHGETEGDAVEFLVADICELDFQAADFIVAYYTVQFVSPKRRQALIDAIYRALNWGGAFLMFEKVRAPDARFQDIASGLYTEFKLGNGYLPEEIIGKTRSLKGVLEPFSTNGNLDLLRRAGFVDVMTIYKYICFEGFLAIK